jgi:hypothetical protein
MSEFDLTPGHPERSEGSQDAITYTVSTFARAGQPAFRHPEFLRVSALRMTGIGESHV